MTAAKLGRLSPCAFLALVFGACAEDPSAAQPVKQGPTVAGSAGTAALAGGGSGDTGGNVTSGGANSTAGVATGGAGAGAGGMGGTTGGTGGALGGSAGAGGAPGLCKAGDCSEFTGGFDGYLFQYPCASGGCSGQMCVMNALTITRAFVLKGDPGTVYRVDLRVRGITESKNYAGGTRRSTSAIDPGAAGGDLWYEGGTAPVSSYSSYELHVTPPVAGAPNDYYLNARDGTDEHDGTTWASNYLAKVLVSGGGSITFKTFDSNCSAIRNCGPKGTSPCTPRTLDLSNAVPAANVTQPIRDANGTAPQWLHIDVLGVEAL